MERAALTECDVVSVGSLLEMVLREGGGNRPVVWGSGFIREGAKVSVEALAFSAVRGHLTRDRIVGGEYLPLGDPGLLADLLLPSRPARRDVIGLVPHRYDREEPVVRTFAARPDVRCLDVSKDPRETIASIAACRFVLSSSLHGLIVADALGVPSCWIEPSAKLEGAGYKFRDYFGAFGQEPPRTRLETWLERPWDQVERHAATWTRPGLDDLRTGLLEALRGAGL